MFSLYPSISSTTCTRGVRKHRSPTLPLLHKRVQGSRQTYGTCREALMLITTTSTTPPKKQVVGLGDEKKLRKVVVISFQQVQKWRSKYAPPRTWNRSGYRIGLLGCGQFLASADDSGTKRNENVSGQKK